MATRKCPFCAEKIQSEAKVCRFCNRDLPLVAQGEKKTSTGVKVLVVFFALVGLGMVAQVCETVLESPSASAPRSQPAPGETVVLVTENGEERVPIVTTLAVWDAIGEAARTNDQYRLRQIDLMGGTYTVAPLTKALVLEIKLWKSASKVRMLEGEHENRTGWVSNDWVGSSPPWGPPMPEPITNKPKRRTKRKTDGKITAPPKKKADPVTSADIEGQTTRTEEGVLVVTAGLDTTAF